MSQRDGSRYTPLFSTMSLSGAITVMRGTRDESGVRQRVDGNGKGNGTAATATNGRSGTDEDLMVRYCGGEARAFDQLYSRHKGPLFRYFLRQCLDWATSEELLQEVWLTLIRNRGRYTVNAKFTTYLYRLAHSRLVDHYRRNARVALEPSTYEEFACEEAQQPERIVELAERQANFQEALNSLPAAQREVFLLRAETDMSLNEIAEVLDIPLERTKSRLRYAVDKLSRQLQDNSSGDLRFRTGTLG